MPRKGAKGKWDLKMSPDEWYWKEDPWKVYGNDEEKKKAEFICGLILNSVETAVDIGCGEGHWTDMYANRVRNMFGCDVSHIAIGRASSNCYINDHGMLRFGQVDITEEAPDIDGEVDCVILSEVLYYIKPDLWETVSDNIRMMLREDDQFIVSVGQYFTEEDIRKIFPWCEFDKVFKLPSEKYEYNLIMSGRKK